MRYEDGVDFLVQIASYRDGDESDEESDELCRRMEVIPRRFYVSEVPSDEQSGRCDNAPADYRRRSMVSPYFVRVHLLPC